MNNADIEHAQKAIIPILDEFHSSLQGQPIARARPANSSTSMTTSLSVFDRISTKLFVDSVWPHRFLACHRRSDRSFFVQGRQFHICARCTGLIIGLPCSILLLPVSVAVPFVFVGFAVALIVDVLTQLANWRESNNVMRFVTGLGTAATFLPTMIEVIRGL